MLMIGFDYLVFLSKMKTQKLALLFKSIFSIYARTEFYFVSMP